MFHYRTPNVTTKEPTDSKSFNSEFNPAYSFELKTDPTQGEVDTFEHYMQVTSHHEDMIYAYYYMDDNNKVRAIYFTNLFFCVNKTLIIFSGKIYENR